MVLIAGLYYIAAEFENVRFPPLWFVASAGLFAGTYWGLGWGMCATISMQGVLLVPLIVAIELHRDREAGGDGTIRSIINHIRGQWWRQRGRCVGCGYDLRGSKQSPRCPECGRPH